VSYQAPALHILTCSTGSALKIPLNFCATRMPRLSMSHFPRATPTLRISRALSDAFPELRRESFAANGVRNRPRSGSAAIFLELNPCSPKRRHPVVGGGRAAALHTHAIAKVPQNFSTLARSFSILRSKKRTDGPLPYFAPDRSAMAVLSRSWRSLRRIISQGRALDAAEST
jgi:hypothetical protein